LATKKVASEAVEEKEEQTKTEKKAKPKANFADSNNVIFDMTMPSGPTKDVKFELIENKKSGMIRMSIREWSHTERYDGPTRNGLLIKVESPETVDQWQKTLNAYLDKVRETL